MKQVGTQAYGIKTPIIKAHDNLEEIVLNSLLSASIDLNQPIDDLDVIGVTEAVVSISHNNYITIDEIVSILKSKFKDIDHIGVLFPILSRNRFASILKALARAFKKLTIMLSYPADEVGNGIIDEELLYLNKVNPYVDIIDEATYLNKYHSFKHPFTNLNMYDYYKEVVEKEGSSAQFVFGNNPADILKYVSDVLVSSIHRRSRDNQILINHGAATVYDLSQIANEKNDFHGYNLEYGLLGTNRATNEKLKLFPNNALEFVYNLKKLIFNKMGKDVEVLVYGDGAFKDPVGHIWELADPVVSPGFTDGLKGSPQEIKLKLLSDDKFSNLKGESLNKAIKEAITNKKSISNTEDSLGTTPRRYSDLIGSLCDLMSGSGDKGTPVVWIKNYFTNYAK